MSNNDNDDFAYFSKSNLDDIFQFDAEEGVEGDSPIQVPDLFDNGNEAFVVELDDSDADSIADDDEMPESSKLRARSLPDNRRDALREFLSKTERFEDLVFRGECQKRLQVLENMWKFAERFPDLLTKVERGMRRLRFRGVFPQVLISSLAGVSKGKSSTFKASLSYLVDESQSIELNELIQPTVRESSMIPLVLTFSNDPRCPARVRVVRFTGDGFQVRPTDQPRGIDEARAWTTLTPDLIEDLGLWLQGESVVSLPDEMDHLILQLEIAPRSREALSCARLGIGWVDGPGRGTHHEPRQTLGKMTWEWLADVGYVLCKRARPLKLEAQLLEQEWPFEDDFRSRTTLLVTNIAGDCPPEQSLWDPDFLALDRSNARYMRLHENTPFLPLELSFFYRGAGELNEVESAEVRAYYEQQQMAQNYEAMDAVTDFVYTGGMDRLVTQLMKLAIGYRKAVLDASDRMIRQFQYDLRRRLEKSRRKLIPDSLSELKKRAQVLIEKDIEVMVPRFTKPEASRRVLEDLHEASLDWIDAITRSVPRSQKLWSLAVEQFQSLAREHVESCLQDMDLEEEEKLGSSFAVSYYLERVASRYKCVDSFDGKWAERALGDMLRSFTHSLSRHMEHYRRDDKLEQQRVIREQLQGLLVSNKKDELRRIVCQLMTLTNNIEWIELEKDCAALQRL